MRGRGTGTVSGQGGLDRTGRKKVTPLGRARRACAAGPPLGASPGRGSARAPEPAARPARLALERVRQESAARGLGDRPRAGAAPRAGGGPQAWAGAVGRAVKGAPGIIRKACSLCLNVALAVFALCALSAACLYAYFYFSESDYFLVKRHDIRGIFRVSRQEVLAAAGLDRPVNTLTFDTQAAVRSLRAIPWVEDASISRTPLPDGITVRVTEYRPKAVVSLDRLYHLDGKGRPFKSLEPGENPDRPIVSGFTLDELLNEGPLAQAAIQEILDLMELLERRSDDWRLDEISEIRRDPDIGLTLFSRRTGVEARLGFGPYAEKAARLGSVTGRLKARGHFAGVTHMNLECAPRVTVRWARGSKPPDVGVPDEPEEGVEGPGDGIPPPPVPEGGRVAGAAAPAGAGA